MAIKPLPINNSSLTKVGSIPEQCILEINYSLEKEGEVSLITQAFPFCLTRSSKYATGMRMLGNC